MPLVWNSVFELGHPAIDAQHRELFARVNGLLAALDRDAPEGEATRLLHFLATYVLEHFAAEEQLMRDIEYPGYEAHRGEHQRFIATVDELRSKRERPLFRTAEVNTVVCDWLTNHVLGSDQALSAALARVRSSGRSVGRVA